MGHGSGPSHRLTFAERSELQRRVRAGETYAGAAAAVGCSSKSVQRLLAKTGGVKSRSKPQSPLRLSLAEREEISRGLLAGESRRVIAMRLGRSPSTVTREVAAAQRRPNGTPRRTERPRTSNRRIAPAQLSIGSIVRASIAPLQWRPTSCACARTRCRAAMRCRSLS